MNIRSSVTSGLQPGGVDAGLLAGLPQRGADGAVVAGVGRAAGEGGLPGVVAQRRGPHGDQQVGVVRAGRRTATSDGPENSTRTAASRLAPVSVAVGVGGVIAASTSAGTRSR